MSGAAGIRAGRAFVEIGLKNQITDGLRRAQSQLKAFGASVRSLGVQLSAAGAAAATPFVLSVRTFSAFADKMAEVRAVTGANDDQFNQLNETAKRLGATTSFTASEVADAMKYLGMAGFETEQILAGVPAVLNLARAGAMDLGTAADIASDVGSAFGLTADEIGRVADVMAATASSANTNVAMMGETLKYAAPLAAAAGQSLEELSAAIGVLGNNGIKATMAGTDLATIMKKLADPAARKALEELGVVTVDSEGDMRSIIDVMRDLGAATAGMSESDKLTFFKDAFDRAAKSGLILSQSAGALAELHGQLQNSTGAAERMAAVMENTLGGAFRRMMSAVEGVQIAIGEALDASLRELYERVTVAAGAVTEFVSAHQGLIAVAASLAGKVAVLGGALTGVGVGAQALAFAFGGVARMITLAAPLVTGVGAALGVLTSPITLIVGGLTALGGALAYVALAGDTFSEKMASLKSIATTAMSATINAITTAWRSVVEFVEPIWNAFVETAGVVFSAIKATVVAAWTAIADVATSVWLAVTDVVGAAWEAIVEIVGPAAIWVRDTVINAWNAISPYIKPALERMKNTIIDAFAAVSFTILNWRNVAALALLTYVHGIVQAANQTKYFFVEVIPAYLRWFRDNWRDIFQTIWNGVKTFSTNVGTNLVNLWAAIADLLQGKGWNFEWTGLLDGFESTIKELPQIAAREIGGLEKELQSEMDALGKSLMLDWMKYRRDFHNRVRNAGGKDKPDDDTDEEFPGLEELGGVESKKSGGGGPLASSHAPGGDGATGAAGGESEGPRYGAFGTFNAAAISQTIAAALGGVTAVAAAAGGKIAAADARSGRQTPEERTARAAEETARNTKELIATIENNQLRFV